MSYSDHAREIYRQELSNIREAGLFKEERFIHSAQAADIEVEFPSGADLKDTILKYVIEEYAEEDDKVTYDTPLISGGLVDSFSMVSLKRFLEVRYKISIPDEDASPEAFDSVNKIADLVTRFLA